VTLKIEKDANRGKWEQQVYHPVGTGSDSFIYVPTANILKINEIARKYRFF
jgi:hypothetical protein